MHSDSQQFVLLFCHFGFAAGTVYTFIQIYVLNFIIQNNICLLYLKKYATLLPQGQSICDWLALCCKCPLLCVLMGKLEKFGSLISTFVELFVSRLLDQITKGKDIPGLTSVGMASAAHINDNLHLGSPDLGTLAAHPRVSFLLLRPFGNLQAKVNHLSSFGFFTVL